ncbi:hypothetical protein D3C72_2181510 [compost metagenome]
MPSISPAKRERSSGENTPEAMDDSACDSSTDCSIIARGLWPSARAFDTSSAVMPKMTMLSSPTCSSISTFAPSSVPMVSAPFSANFMLPVPEASMPAVEICSDRSAAGTMISASETL